jgi:hypothetical protein
MTALAALMLERAGARDLLGMARLASHRLLLREAVRRVAVRACVVALEQRVRELVHVILRVTRDAPSAGLASVLVRPMAVRADQLLLSPGCPVLDELLSSVAVAAALDRNPRFLVGRVAALAPHGLVNVDHGRAGREIHRVAAVATIALPGAFADACTIGEVVACEAMRLRHPGDRDVDVVVAILASLRDRRPEAFDLAEVAARAARLRPQVLGDVVPDGLGTRAPSGILALLLVTTRAAGIAGGLV